MKTFNHDNRWWAHQLRGFVLAGYGIVAAGPDGVITASLRVDGDCFLMTGATGQHRLNIQATDSARLLAHWKGFMELNAAKAQVSA